MLRKLGVDLDNSSLLGDFEVIAVLVRSCNQAREAETKCVNGYRWV